MDIADSRLQSSTIDRLSDLDHSLLDNILCRLPTKDVVRTSILSTKWRNRWTLVPKLVFNDRYLRDIFDVASDEEAADEEERFIKFTDSTISRHCGLIHTFKLSMFFTDEVSDSDVDEWVSFVTREENHLLRKLVVYRYARNWTLYTLPSCVFSCQKLKHLHLANISLELPDDFTGFRNLVCLVLENMSHEALPSLIHSCPMLEKLDLRGFTIEGCFTIRAPKLKRVSLHGICRAVYFENCPLLQNICLSRIDVVNAPFADELPQKALVCNLFEEQDLICRLNDLELCGDVLQRLHAENFSQNLFSASYSYPLKNLCLYKISLRNQKETTSALIILGLFPNIQWLDITVRRDNNPQDPVHILDVLSQSQGCYFPRLEILNLALFYVDDEQVPEGLWRPEFAVVKFLLARSPKLKEIKIECDQNAQNNETFLMREVHSFERASSEQVAISFSLVNIW